MLSRGQFAAEFPTESDLIEFKRGVGRDAIQTTAVAFSNARGGVILVGVEDDGTVIGRRAEPGTIDALHEALAPAHDLGRYEIQALDVDGLGVTVLAIARREQGFAQTSAGRVLERRGTRDDVPIGADLQRLINERATRRFETTATTVGVSESDDNARRRLEQAYGWPDRSADAERLGSVGLVDGGQLTVAGALWLTPDPAATLGKAFVEILRYPDDTIADYDRRDEIRGPLDHQVEASARLVMDHLGTEVVVLGLRRFELPRIPEVVVREALANAVAHRSYETSGTPVRVELRPGVVRITSPGGLPEPVTVANMRETNAARNLDVIRVLRRFGLAEDAGRGVDVMQDAMRAEMLDPPRFADTGHSVVVELPVRSAVAPVERAWVRELESRGDLGPFDRILLVHAARGEVLTNTAVRDLTSVDSREARTILQRLCVEGLLRRHGQRGGSTYTLADSLRPPAGLRLGSDEIADLVERLAVEGPIANADVRAATGLDRVESLAILDRLVAEGRLVRSGERRGTRYQTPRSAGRTS